MSAKCQSCQELSCLSAITYCANDHIVRDRMLTQVKESEMKVYRYKKVLEELKEQLKLNQKELNRIESHTVRVYKKRLPEAADF